MTKNDHLRKGYETLIGCCLEPARRTDLLQFTEVLFEEEGELEAADALERFMSYLDNEGVHLLMGLDWKAQVQDLQWAITSALKMNYGASIELPSASNYPRSASVSTEGVFTDYDKAIRAEGFEMSFVATDSDMYVVVVHKSADRKTVGEAIELMGFDRSGPA